MTSEETSIITYLCNKMLSLKGLNE